ncbi:MAG: TonB-dependent receptor [Saprospiraceae bacterium]|nr:TonB-dependent receptor [Saprospiraceae bacterium]MBK8371466.1 TonB-dependent receptor [Saprospiraceae bacterium]MBK8548730.1 TonB-dependent receptor [Saprospiraceae bacterium]MBP6695313.1 TonB-dependent receptor [Saprospiraceae bacterium]
MKPYIIIMTLWLLPFLAHSQTRLSIPVSGACGMCKERIEGIAKSTIGILKAKYSIENQTLLLEVDPLFQKTELNNALLKAGHDNDGLVATDDAYEALHSCCKYRIAPESNPFSVTLTGGVFEKSKTNEEIPLIGATVFWEGSNDGTVTNTMGEFEIPAKRKGSNLIISYVGYSPDTILVNETGYLKIVLEQNLVLDAVEITHRKRTTEVSYLDPVKIQSITQKELLKAACCNLAESFDTTPAVDASVTDAVTGTRKIEMLGLAGPYVQITRENMPDIRGLSALYGLAYTPGPWAEGIQLNMGAGSVVNGFESITGQINVELRKPCHGDLFFLNGYANQAGRFEFNSFSKNILSESWSTSNLMHVSTRAWRLDNNDDGFMDNPITKQLGLINRWKYTNGDGHEAQVGVKVSYLDNLGGQMDFHPNDVNRNKFWGSQVNTTRVEVWAKNGYVNMAKPYQTLGFQFSGVYHVQDGIFGLRTYDATQKSLYFNSIYQDIIGNTDHQIRTGFSTQWDAYDEKLLDTVFKRNEIVPGVFGEYTYKGSEKFTFLAGLRVDYHNNFGFFVTPRMNVRFAPTETTVFRVSVGRGQRTASIFSENAGIFATSRNIMVRGTSSDKPYGLNPEIAWNYGFSLTQEFNLWGMNWVFALDANRVDFVNQIVVDMENPREIVFYNLTGQSFANSVQGQFDIQLTRWLDVRLAYRYNDVRTSYGETLLRRPLNSPHRAFANIAVKLGKGWKWDYTLNRMSESRLPSTENNLPAYRIEKESPVYFLSNTQINKEHGRFEYYVGVENLFDFHLNKPIIAADMPFSPYFDGSLVWGPIMGRNIYVGFRYNITEDEKTKNNHKH